MYRGEEVNQMIKSRIMIPAIATILLVGCGGASDGLLDSTESVCDEFAAHARDGLPASERSGVTDSISEVVDNAADGVHDAFAALERTADDSDSAYQLAADAFAQACFDAGWNG